MKTAIFRRFFFISDNRKFAKRTFCCLMVAIFLCIGIFSIITGRILKENTKTDMYYILQVMDETFDYSKDLQEQLSSLPVTINQKITRYSILNKTGKIIADTKSEFIHTMENHAEREEIIQAINTGYGSALRYSKTVEMKLFYAAIDSKDSNYILRIAVPYDGIKEHFIMLFPAIIIVLGMSALLCFFLTKNFVSEIIKPLCQITDTLEKFTEECPELKFKTYQYNQLNRIADATKQMAKSVRKNIDEIQFEKMIRQEFFSNASHELKTPITSIRGYTELLKGGFAQDEKTKEEFLERIMKETDHMTNLINDILTISRLETQEAQEVKTEIRIPILLEDVLDTYQPIAAEYQVKIEIECIPISIFADIQQIYQIFSNLIGNAVKYNHPNGYVKVIVKKEKEDLTIIVQDNGVGIPKESQVRIFERFYRVDQGRSRKMGGTGLGLSIVKHIVNYYHGSVSLASEVGVGSKFIVWLPGIVES